MIKSFQHKGLELFFRTGKKNGIQPHHAEKLRLIMAVIDDASGPEDLASPRLGLHKLSGGLAGFWSVKVSGNWRIIFRFDGENAAAINYLDYH